MKLLYIDDSKAAAERYLGTVDAHSVELCKDNMARIELKQGNPDSRWLLHASFKCRQNPFLPPLFKHRLVKCPFLVL